jgi:metal-responsive CopG/Arc/MetJ family transcriptional regulator
MAKTNISMPDALLEEIDRRAAAAQTTRSGFIQEAAAHYLSALDEAAADRARAERLGLAYDKMRRVAEHMPPGTDGTAIIRRFRDQREPWLAAEDARDAER